MHVVGDVKKHMLWWPGKMTRQLDVRSDVVEFSNFVGFAERSGRGVLFLNVLLPYDIPGRISGPRATTV